MALNPHQKNKVDISSFTEEEQKLFRLYGKLPNKKDIFSKKLQERKYFDSGDYAMSKAGKSDGASLGGGLGREHPTPENIPHLSQVQSVGSPPASEARGSISAASTTGPVLTPTHSHTAGNAGSPVRETSILQQGVSVDDQDNDETEQDAAKSNTSTAEPRGIPIRK